MRSWLGALALAIGLLAPACVSGTGSGCTFDTDCASDICCLTCAQGPCNSGRGDQGVCCAGSCQIGSDGGCPTGTSCTDAGMCQ